MRPVRETPPPAGGRDLVVPGDGVRLAATRWHGAGTPVLLLHGLASQRRFWNLVAPLLGGLDVVALDQRGHGDSERPESGYDHATVALDAVTALDALGISRAVVVGHSWGAQVALRLAADHPSRALAVVAVDGGLYSPADSMTREEALDRLAPPDLAVPPEELPAKVRGGALGPWWSDAVEDAVLPLFGVGADGLARARLPRERHLDIVGAMWDYRAAEVLPRVAATCWAALAFAADDTEEWNAAKRASLDRAAALLDRHRLITLGGGVHDVPLQWPALVAGLIRAAADEAASGGGR